jgi:hypothetical protein
MKRGKTLNSFLVFKYRLRVGYSSQKQYSEYGQSGYTTTTIQHKDKTKTGKTKSGTKRAEARCYAWVNICYGTRREVLIVKSRTFNINMHQFMY